MFWMNYFEFSSKVYVGMYSRLVGLNLDDTISYNDLYGDQSRDTADQSTLMDCGTTEK